MAESGEGREGERHPSERPLVRQKYLPKHRYTQAPWLDGTSLVGNRKKQRNGDSWDRPEKSAGGKGSVTFH